jgi:hypothetical protein
MAVAVLAAFMWMAASPASVCAQPAAFKAQEPVLLTAAGQSADLNMAKVLLERNKIALKTAPLAGPDDLKDAKSLVVVIGGSTKGLGAAGIDADKEAARVQRLMAQASARKIPIIGMHIGGKARRGDLSDKFIELVSPGCSFLLVVREGDSDGIFSKIIAAKKINARIVDKLSELQEPLKTIYGK